MIFRPLEPEAVIVTSTDIVLASLPGLPPEYHLVHAKYGTTLETYLKANEQAMAITTAYIMICLVIILPKVSRGRSTS